MSDLLSSRIIVGCSTTDRYLVGMRQADQQAGEPYESRDLELGQALRSWLDAHADLLSAEVDGPLDAPGMDPTWLLRISGPLIEAEVRLFYGPLVDVSMFLPQQVDDGMYVGGEDGVTVQRLVEILDGLDGVNRGGAVPSWLRRAGS